MAFAYQLILHGEARLRQENGAILPLLISLLLLLLLFLFFLMFFLTFFYSFSYCFILLVTLDSRLHILYSLLDQK